MNKTEQVPTVPAGADKEKIIKDFLSAYDDNWVVGLREPLQNSGDAQGRNILRGVIPEDRVVEAVFKVNTKDNSIEYYDKGAGGMREEVLGSIVTSLGDSTKEEAGSGGGKFGIGMWVTTGLCEKGGKMYIESKYEKTGKTFSSVLLPSGRCIKVGEGKDSEVKYGSPSEVKDIAGISVDSEPPEKWDVGGTLLRIENVEERYMESLSDWDKVEEELRRKFALLSEQFNIKFIIDGEEHEFEVAEWDEFMGDIIRREEDLNVQHKEGKIDELVFFEMESDEAPWGSNIPLVKTRPYFDKPFMIIRDFRTYNAPSVISKGGSVGAFAIIDSLCDEHDYENLDHDGLSITKFSDKVEIGSIATEVHRENVNVKEDSISEEEMLNSCKSGLGEIANHMKNVTEGNIDKFGVEYEPSGVINNIEEENKKIRVEVGESDDIIKSENFIIEFSIEKWGNNKEVFSKKKNIKLDEDSKEVVLDVNDFTGSYRVVCTLKDKETNKVADKDSTAFGVENLSKSGVHRKGGGVVENSKKMTNSELLNSLTVDKVKWDEEASDFRVRKEEGEFIMYVNPNSTELVEHVTLSNKKKGEERQKRLFMKEASIAMLDWLMYNSESKNSEVFDMYQDIKDRIENIKIKQNT